MNQSRAVLGVCVVASLILAACSSKPDGCSKDTDCKDDRVCNAGACVEPRSAAGTAAQSTSGSSATTEDKSSTEASCAALILKKCGFDPDAPQAAPTASQNACYSAFANEYINAAVKPCKLNR